MSSKAKKIVKEVQAEERARRHYVMGTLAGSAALSIGKLAGKTEKEIVDGFDEIKDRFPPVKNILEMCDFFIKEYGMKEEYKNSLVLFTDSENKWTPVITVIEETGDGPIIYPLGSDGYYPAIMNHMDEERVEMEYIYEEDENEEEE